MKSEWDLNKIAIAIIALIVILLIAYFVFLTPKDKQEKNNILNDNTQDKNTETDSKNTSTNSTNESKTKIESKDKNLEGTTVLLPELPKQPEKIITPENVKEPELGKDSETKQPAR